MENSEATSDLCIAAGRDALERGGIAPADVDALVIATNTPDYPFPSTALIAADALGMPDALTLDLNQYGCPASLFGLYFGAPFFLDASCRNVLVIAAEAMSRITNPEKPDSVFFGDGAGAFLLRRQRSPDAGFLDWDLRGKASMDLAIRNGGSRVRHTAQSLADGGQYLYMNGRAVWEKATALMTDSIRFLLDAHQLTLADIDLFLFHQANLRMTSFASRRDRGRAPLVQCGSPGELRGGGRAECPLRALGRVPSRRSGNGRGGGRRPDVGRPADLLRC